MRAEGFTPMEGPEAAFKFLKRYVSGRYTQPDAQGSLILDLLAPIRPETPGGAAAAIGRRDGNAQP